MEGGASYDMTGADYSRAGAAAGYGAVPPSTGMRSSPGMESSAQSSMGMGMYGSMGGYGGYSMGGYQQPQDSSPSTGSGARMGGDAGYVDAYGSAAPSGGAPAATASNSNYGAGRPQSSSATQARVDRSYRPY